MSAIEMIKIRIIKIRMVKIKMIKIKMIRTETIRTGMNGIGRLAFRRCANALAVIAATLLTACTASVPTHYHTLLGAADETKSPPNPTSSFLIDVQPVAIPPQVDQPQLIVREGGEGMLVLEHERWIAPLGDELRAALSAELSRQLGTQDVAGQPRPAKANIVRIKIDLRRFDSAPGQYAALEAIWSVHKADEKSEVVLCTSRERESVGLGYDELVRGHQRALIALADTVAAAVQHLAAGTNAVCPSG